MGPTKADALPADPPIPFDVTQEIEPALAELILRREEPTLTQTDFDEIGLALPREPR